MAAVRHLAPYEHERLNALFEKVDVDNSGKITVQEFRNAFDFGRNSCDIAKQFNDSSWIDELASNLDVDLSGDIDYTEFLVAAMDQNIEERLDLVWAAFRAFDLDGNNTISKSELEHVLANDDAARVLMSAGKMSWDAGKMSWDQITFEEFVELLKCG